MEIDENRGKLENLYNFFSIQGVKHYALYDLSKMPIGVAKYDNCGVNACNLKNNPRNFENSIFVIIFLSQCKFMQCSA